MSGRCDTGLVPVSVNSGEKHPWIRGWQNVTMSDREEKNDQESSQSGIGHREASNVSVLDVDASPSHTAPTAGTQLWSSLIDQHGEPKAWTQTSGSNGATCLHDDAVVVTHVQTDRLGF